MTRKMNYVFFYNSCLSRIANYLAKMSPKKELFTHIQVRGDVSNTKKTSFSNPRYPLDGMRYKNWLNLTENCREYPDVTKRIHLDAMIKRKNESSSETQPEFLKLMYLIRFLTIAKAYFPKGSQYESACGEIKDHPGWNDLMTRRERIILASLFSAYKCVEKNPSNTTPFDRVDKKFGIYRHDRWALAA